MYSKGKELNLGAEPPLIKLCRESPSSAPSSLFAETHTEQQGVIPKTSVSQNQTALFGRPAQDKVNLPHFPDALLRTTICPFLL